jgi:hypothetical protein
MPLSFLGQPLRSATVWSVALVLVVVIGLHACGLYEVAAGLNTLRPEDTTQRTLSVALIAPPPPPPAAAPATAPPRPARPRAATHGRAG